MTEKTQRRINRLAGPCVPLSLLFLFLSLSPGMIVCGPGAEDGQLDVRLLMLLFSVPGLVLGILSTSVFDRILG